MHVPNVHHMYVLTTKVCQTTALYATYWAGVKVGKLSEYLVKQSAIVWDRFH